MAVGIRFTDNSNAVLTQMSGNIKKALTAMGIRAVKLIVNKMQHGYSDSHITRDMRGRNTGGTHTDIRWSSTLQNDVSYEVEKNAVNTVTVGNSEAYAEHVHEGTYRLKGRPYIRDAIMDGKSELQSVAATALKEGF